MKAIKIPPLKYNSLYSVHYKLKCYFYCCIIQIADVRDALVQQSSAFVELAEKCQAIFKAQHAMMELIPESVDLAFLKEDHRSKLQILFIKLLFGMFLLACFVFGVTLFKCTSAIITCVFDT